MCLSICDLTLYDMSQFKSINSIPTYLVTLITFLGVLSPVWTKLSTSHSHSSTNEEVILKKSELFAQAEAIREQMTNDLYLQVNDVYEFAFRNLSIEIDRFDNSDHSVSINNSNEDNSPRPKRALYADFDDDDYSQGSYDRSILDNNAKSTKDSHSIWKSFSLGIRGFLVIFVFILVALFALMQISYRFNFTTETGSKDNFNDPIALPIEKHREAAEQV